MLYKYGSFFAYPIPSMYGIFTYIYHKNQPNVGKYTIHGWYGYHQRKWLHPNPKNKMKAWSKPNHRRNQDFLQLLSAAPVSWDKGYRGLPQPFPNIKGLLHPQHTPRTWVLPRAEPKSPKIITTIWFCRASHENHLLGLLQDGTTHHGPTHNYVLLKSLCCLRFPPALAL